jgi:glycosyltransferase involved in cell wall biosynthesis
MQALKVTGQPYKIYSIEMKIIFFTKYTRKGASSRLRTFQYIDFFQSQGIDCVLSPFFSDDYLDEVYRTKKHNKRQALRSFFLRLKTLFSVGKYDKVVIEKELFPFFPSFFECLLRLAGVQYIVDYDDAIFHNYDIHPNRLIRTILKNKIRNVMRYASVVVAGNEYIREHAITAGAKEVVIIPTVIDVEKYKVREQSLCETFVIGWIGSPITFKYLPGLKGVFETLSLKHKIKLIWIGSNESLGLPLAEEIIMTWKEEDEIEKIGLFDAGIMPLEDNIWERGKCGYKLIQYMGCGIPVIGTPIGVNNTIIQQGVNGFKANNLDDWLMSLEYLLKNRQEAHAMGLKGRLEVERHYSLQIFRNKWLELLKR